MQKNKALQIVAKAGLKSALENRGYACRLWFHQPKVPAKLLEQQKGK